MTSEISELSVADRNNQIFLDVLVRRPFSADKILIVSISYGNLTNLTCHKHFEFTANNIYIEYYIGRAVLLLQYCLIL